MKISMLIERIQSELKRLNMRPSELARQIHLSATAVNKILSGDAKDVKASTLYAMSQVFNRDMEWLYTGKSVKNDGNTYNWKDAFTEGEMFDVIITDDAMSPNCQPGDIVTANPLEQWQHDDLVAVSMDGNHAIIRKYKELGQTAFLEATNPAYPEKFRFQELDDKTQIIGKISKISRHL